MTSNNTALKKIKKINKSFHCQDVIGQHNFLICKKRLHLVMSGDFFRWFWSYLLRNKIQMLVHREPQVLSAHIKEIPEVTGDYCRYFSSGKVWFPYEAGGPEIINKSCKG
jgi:hypothetical protein